MGFNGEVVVFRSAAEPRDIAPLVGTETHELLDVWPLKDGWRAMHIRPYAQPYKYDAEWLAATAENTGAPVLACWVFESDVAHIRGLSHGAGAWEAWLNIPYGAEMMTRDTVIEEWLELPQPEADRLWTRTVEAAAERMAAGIPSAAMRAAEWAGQAGYAVPAGPIEELLAGPTELFVEVGFFKLLVRLGLAEADFDPGDG